jgi:uncharacterized protein
VLEIVRVFLDANVLFSAAYKPDNRFLQFWMLMDVVVLTSPYVADEARRNCVNMPHRNRLKLLIEQTHLVTVPLHPLLPEDIHLPLKDQPVLAATLQAGANFLATGDINHFGPYMEAPIHTPTGKLNIIAPGKFLDDHIDRL